MTSRPRIASRLATLLLTAALGVPVLAASPLGGLAVVSVDPPRHAVGAPTAARILISFDAPLDLASLDSASVRVYGTWSGVVPGSLSLVGGGSTLQFQPARPYFAGELITVILSESVAAIGGATLSNGHTHTFWAGSAAGNGLFALASITSTRFQGEGLVQSYGLFAGDLDADGAPDFSIPNEVANDVRVLGNDGCTTLGALTSYAVPSSASPSANASHDLDGDGVMDLVTANIGTGSMSVLLGDGAGGYQPAVSYAAGTNSRGIALLDADGDGHVDAVVANRTSSNMALFLNLGDGTFGPPSMFEAGGSGETTVTATDANDDGHTDLFVAHYSSHTATLLLGDGQGNFTLSANEAVGTWPWKSAAGDLNGDGKVDFVTCDASSDTMTVLLGDGAGGMTVSATLAVGAFPTSVVMGDLEGDGDLDLVSSDVFGGTWTCYLNDGSGNFPTVFTLPSISAASCATLVDFNRDGLLDIVGVDEFSDNVLVWRQSHLALFGVQRSSCNATLRIDNLASAGGFGGQPAHAIALGDTFFIGVTALPNTNWVLAAGLPQWPGLPSAFGLFNLVPPPLLLFSFATNTEGESSVPLVVPLSAPPGLSIALQAFVDTVPGWRATNPEVILAVP
jgi:hypothetical protein